jgi:SAM-dependent methyltransferase
MKCRGCSAPLALTLIDLGTSPPANAYLRPHELDAAETAETWVPLRVLVCERCWLVQTEDFRAADSLFDAEYAYFSSFSATWLAHAERYVDEMARRFSLTEASRVVEVAANDGYLLQFVARRGIPCLGVEPTASTARAARERGLEIRETFFGEATASALADEGWQADLMVANNVLAHVPDINDFLLGFARLLKPDGVATFEFPHLTKLIELSLFDTIYHEHYSYLSLTAVRHQLVRNGLDLFDVETLPTHGGSLRVYVQRAGGPQPIAPRVEALLAEETDKGVTTRAYYGTLGPAAESIKGALLDFLREKKNSKKTVTAYGAAAKGNTLLNYAGVGSDLIGWVADANPHKQGKFMPGSRIPIVPPSRITEERPDYLLILPWNLRDEVMAQQAQIGKWGGCFVVAVPTLQVIVP